MRRIVVTGANKGIGLAIVEAVLEEHADTFVYLGSRDEARGRAAAESLAKHAARLEVFPIDVSKSASIRDAAKRLRDVRLYGLVNNAGINRDGLAEMLQTNVIGLRECTESFVPLLDPRGGRVVNVTSASGPIYVSARGPEEQRALVDPTTTWSRFDELVAAARAQGQHAYGLSKALANLATLILAREHPSLIINACTPGFIDTDLTRHYLAPGQTAASAGMKSPAEGARSAMHLLFGNLSGSGHYYGSDAKRSPLDRYRAPGDAEYSGN